MHIASQIYDGSKWLCPDMAFCLGKLTRPSHPKHNFLGLLRTDKEKKIQLPISNQDVRLKSRDWLEEGITSTRIFTAFVKRLQVYSYGRLNFLYGLKRRLYNRLAMQRLRRGCDILSSGAVVVTDRLHGHILCTLLEIPHVVLDNNYRKIGNYIDTWQTDNDLCSQAETLDDAILKAKKLYNKYV